MQILLDSGFRCWLYEGMDPLEAMQDRIQPPRRPRSGIGDPPAEFAPLHLHRFVDRWLVRLRDRLDDPVQVESVHGERRVQVLGAAVYSFGADGRVAGFRWTLVDNTARLVRVADDELDLLDLTVGRRWLQPYAEAFAVALRWRLGRGDDAPLHAYVHWAFERFARRLRCHVNVRELRHRIATALALDHTVLAIARRVELALVPKESVQVAHYNVVVSHLDRLRRLAAEAPALVPAYVAFRERLPEYDQPAALPCATGCWPRASAPPPGGSCTGAARACCGSRSSSTAARRVRPRSTSSGSSMPCAPRRRLPGGS